MYRIASLSHVRTFSTGIHVPHVQLAAYVPYHDHSGSTRHAYVPASLRPYATVSFATDPYAPVKPRESALIPIVTSPPENTASDQLALRAAPPHSNNSYAFVLASRKRVNPVITAFQTGYLNWSYSLWVTDTVLFRAATVFREATVFRQRP